MTGKDEVTHLSPSSMCLWQVWIRLSTLALKPRGDTTWSIKRGYQWPQNGHLSATIFLKKLCVIDCKSTVLECLHSKKVSVCVIPLLLCDSLSGQYVIVKRYTHYLATLADLIVPLPMSFFLKLTFSAWIVSTHCHMWRSSYWWFWYLTV